MARAKRHYIPGQIWHLTHRCHKRDVIPKSIQLVAGRTGQEYNQRKNLKTAEGYQLREPSASYSTHFDIKNEDIGANNTYYWDINDEYSIG